MALELFIPPCIHHPSSSPSSTTYPTATNLDTRAVGVDPELLPKTSWHEIVRLPQPGGLELAAITHRALYGEEGLKEAEGVPAVRNEYLAWAMEGRRPLE